MIRNAWNLLWEFTVLTHNRCRFTKAKEARLENWWPSTKSPNPFRLLHLTDSKVWPETVLHLNMESWSVGNCLGLSGFAYVFCVQACADTHQEAWHRPWLSIHRSNNLLAHGYVMSGTAACSVCSHCIPPPHRHNMTVTALVRQFLHIVALAAVKFIIIIWFG